MSEKEKQTQDMETEASVEENQDVMAEEENEKEPSTGQKENLRNGQEESEIDSDDEKPRIFLRNFAEITEIESDEDEIHEIVISDSDNEDSSMISSQANASTLNSLKQIEGNGFKGNTQLNKEKDAPPHGNVDKLLELVDLELTVETDSNKSRNPSLSRACTKLASWLQHRVRLENSSKPTDRQTFSTQRPKAQLKQVKRRGSGAAATNHSRVGQLVVPVANVVFQPNSGCLLYQNTPGQSSVQLEQQVKSSSAVNQQQFTNASATTYRIENGNIILVNSTSPVGSVTVTPSEHHDQQEIVIVEEHHQHQSQQSQSAVRPSPQSQLNSSISPSPTILRKTVSSQQTQALSGMVTLTPISTSVRPTLSTTSCLQKPAPVSIKSRPVQSQTLSDSQAVIFAKRANVMHLAKTKIVNQSASSVNVAAEVNVTAGNQKPIPGTLEDQDKTENNKTFPSLVVQLRTCLVVKPDKEMLTKARSSLDSRVKSVLVESPAKFTEWLMKRGLLKLNHCCNVHKSQSFLLGIFSNTNLQPFSGGYVWKSRCCTEKQISVFQGSIFEGSKYPPGSVLKLIYHWACQTASTNILQWVQVSGLYLKNFFALMRSVCTIWLHEMGPTLGGASKYVEVGVITIGSTADTSRGPKNVKVEILGVFDPSTKRIRLKVVNGLLGNLFKTKEDSNDTQSAMERGARAFQILWSLLNWVDKRSILLVDGVIDKALLYEVGFTNVRVCDKHNSDGATLSNSNVMNYLTNVVPNIFSNTLSVLSKSIVQQFLDELSWREVFAHNSSTCFENMLDQIGVLTKVNFRGGESLISRLKKTIQNPLVDWSWSADKQIRRSPKYTIPMRLRNEPGIKECIQFVTKDEPILPPPPVYVANRCSSTAAAKKQSSSVAAAATVPSSSSTHSVANIVTNVVQKRRSLSDPASSEFANTKYYKEIYQRSFNKVHPLQYYYYGEIEGEEEKCKNSLILSQRFLESLKCPLCTHVFLTSRDVCRHLYTHIGSVVYHGSKNSVCGICLKDLPLGMTVAMHVEIAHQMVENNTCCRICEERFKTEQDLVIHMWSLHHRRETPYKCGVCHFSSSFHYSVVEHHVKQHSNEATVMCPLCLQIMGCANTAQLREVINHLQTHAKRRSAKTCPRCVLQFVNDLDLRVHLSKNHCSQECSPKWVPYVLRPNEKIIMMTDPPALKTPLDEFFQKRSVTAPPFKKLKMIQYAGPASVKKKFLTMNANLTYPIDTNEKFGGSKFKIVIPEYIKGSCAECGQDVSKQNHFVGRLNCNKCRFRTSCQVAMDIHHEKNHQLGSKSLKPVIKTNGVNTLKLPMRCECRFSSDHPTKLALHLTCCEKITAFPTN